MTKEQKCDHIVGYVDSNTKYEGHLIYFSDLRNWGYKDFSESKRVNTFDYCPKCASGLVFNKSYFKQYGGVISRG